MYVKGISFSPYVLLNMMDVFFRFFYMYISLYLSILKMVLVIIVYIWLLWNLGCALPMCLPLPEEHCITAACVCNQA